MIKGRNTFWWIYYPVVTLFLLEAALWILAYRPYQHESFQVRATPRNWLEGDSLMGFRLGLGEFELIVNEGLSFRATHLAEGRRDLGAFYQGPYPTKMDIHGCSYAYGYGLDDSLTLGSLVAKELPRYQVRNWAVPGHSTLHALLRLEQQIKENDLPHMVVLTYASFHAERNSLNAEFRRSLSLGFSQNTDSAHFQRFRYPYLDGDHEIKYQDWNTLYDHWPGRSHSALINAFQSTSEFWQAANRNKEERSLEVLRRIKDLCEEQCVKLLFCPLTLDDATFAISRQMAQMGVDTLDTALDLSLPEFQNYPYDTHPNARAHAHYTKGIIEGLKYFWTMNYP